METLIFALIAIGILIFVHELGHFLFAKLVNVGVVRFSLGFGPELIGFKKGETRYVISVFPFGGYVKLYGENPGEEIEDIDRAFIFKKPWDKSKIVIGGPLFNIVFAYLVFIIVILSGIPRVIPVIGDLERGGPAYKSGIRPGDKVLEIDGVRVKYWDELSECIRKKNGNPVTIKVLRGNKTLEFKVKPKEVVLKDIFGRERKRWVIGIIASGDYVLEKVPIYKIPYIALKQTFYISYVTIYGIYKIITRSIPASSIGGPLMIMKIAGEQAKSGIINFLNFLGIISVNLGVINLIPIPILDGWYLLTFLVEAVRGRPVSEEKAILMQKIGIGILVFIMILILYNDIIRIFFK